jgi:hypothetical protein
MDDADSLLRHMVRLPQRWINPYPYFIANMVRGARVVARLGALLSSHTGAPGVVWHDVCTWPLQARACCGACCNGLGGIDLH